jgi:hypothetical protein
MKKIYTLLLLFTITLFYSIPTQAYDIPLNYGVSDNDQAFVQTKNLFDKDTAILGSFIDPSGNIQSNPTEFYHPDYIPIEAGQSITLSANAPTALRIVFYNASQIFIIRNVVVGFTAFTATAPANTKFFRVSGATAQINSFQSELGSTATSYANYGFLSLNDIFVNNQLVSNPNFDNGLTDWTSLNAGTPTVNNGIATFTATATNGLLVTSVATVVGNSYFSISRFKASSNLVSVRVSDAVTYSSILYSHSGSNEFEYISSKFTQISPAAVNIQIRDTRTSGFTPISIDFLFLTNLTAIGIDHLTKITLDKLYEDWQTNNIYNQGFTDGYTDGFNDGYTDGFTDGYDDGFDDGVASDTSFAVGYALGLSQGADMETGSSLLILIVALIGFILMIIGFITKRGIFNLLSTGAFIVLGGLLVEFVGFIIIAIGLVLINIYYAFFGNI